MYKLKIFPYQGREEIESMGELNKIKDDAVEISKRYSCVDILKDFGYPIKIRGKWFMYAKTKS